MSALLTRNPSCTGLPRPRRAAGRRLAALLLAALSSLPAVGHAAGYPGFGLNASRVVVMGDANKGTMVTALNNSTNVYLVQSSIWPAKGVTGYPVDAASPTAAGGVPFIVTPPLKRMEANSQLPLRILTTPNNTLPRDRESLFFLAAKAIPSVPPADANGEQKPRVVMALQQFVKLFYRPASLKPHAIFDGDVAPQLRMSLAGGRLHVTNPTPYHITFGVLTVNGRKVDPEALRVMVPPMGSQDYPLPSGVTRGEVVWQVIDEFGLVTAVQKRTVS
ncbi:TPA: molecular chaperone [Serratia marcescens]